MATIKLLIIIIINKNYNTRVESQRECDQLLVFLRRIWFLLPQACVVQRVPLWLNDKSPNPQNSIFKWLWSVNVGPRRLLSLVLLNRDVVHAFLSCPPPQPPNKATVLYDVCFVRRYRPDHPHKSFQITNPARCNYLFHPFHELCVKLRAWSGALLI